MTAPAVRPADGTEAVCAGCRRLITWCCPSYVPTEFGSWTDCDVVDLDVNGYGDDGRVCGDDGEPHRPVKARVSVCSCGEPATMDPEGIGPICDECLEQERQEGVLRGRDYEAWSAL